MKKLLLQLKELYLRNTTLGLCHPLFTIKKYNDYSEISKEDCIKLFGYIKENTPDDTGEFLPYSWGRGDKASRIKWLDTHIELNS